MSHPDTFALKNSGLNEFLFAEIGTELNGSPLTILSVLARLDRIHGLRQQDSPNCRKQQ